MTIRNIADVALRIYGVTLLFSALATIPNIGLFSIAASPDFPQTAVRVQQVTYILNVVLYAGVGAFLLRDPSPIVQRFIPEGPPLKIAITAKGLTMLALTLLGLWEVIGGLITLAPALYGFVFKPEFLDQTSRWEFMWERQRDAVVRGAVEMVLGGVLSAARDKLIERLRVSGRAGVP
ncbi:MAG TPA: hypothetical protein VGZ27_02580 [Vicinamibacterales bacterium]|nr:hypothetical protein [Vicinamibacterales bacterium]